MNLGQPCAGNDELAAVVLLLEQAQQSFEVCEAEPARTLFVVQQADTIGVHEKEQFLGAERDSQIRSKRQRRNVEKLATVILTPQIDNRKLRLLQDRPNGLHVELCRDTSAPLADPTLDSNR